MKKKKKKNEITLNGEGDDTMETYEEKLNKFKANLLKKKQLIYEKPNKFEQKYHENDDGLYDSDSSNDYNHEYYKRKNIKRINKFLNLDESKNVKDQLLSMQLNQLLYKDLPPLYEFSQWDSFYKAYETTKRYFSDSQNVERLQNAIKCSFVRKWGKNRLFEYDTYDEKIQYINRTFYIPSIILRMELNKLLDRKKILSHERIKLAEFINDIEDFYVMYKNKGSLASQEDENMIREIIKILPTEIAESYVNNIYNKRKTLSIKTLNDYLQSKMFGIIYTNPEILSIDKNKHINSVDKPKEKLRKHKPSKTLRNSYDSHQENENYLQENQIENNVCEVIQVMQSSNNNNENHTFAKEIFNNTHHNISTQTENFPNTINKIQIPCEKINDNHENFLRLGEKDWIAVQSSKEFKNEIYSKSHKNTKLSNQNMIKCIKSTTNVTNKIKRRKFFKLRTSTDRKLKRKIENYSQCEAIDLKLIQHENKIIKNFKIALNIERNYLRENYERKLKDRVRPSYKKFGYTKLRKLTTKTSAVNSFENDLKITDFNGTLSNSENFKNTKKIKSLKSCDKSNHKIDDNSEMIMKNYEFTKTVDDKFNEAPKLDTFKKIVDSICHVYALCFTGNINFISFLALLLTYASGILNYELMTCKSKLSLILLIATLIKLLYTIRLSVIKIVKLKKIKDKFDKHKKFKFIQPNTFTLMNSNTLKMKTRWRSTPVDSSTYERTGALEPTGIG